MQHDVKLHDEPGRLAALERTGLIGSQPDAESDHLTELASGVYGASMAYIALLDDRRAWLKSIQGADISELPVEMTFCQYTIRQDSIVAVDDTLQDERFRNHPLVTGPMAVRSYLGAPLTTPDGYNIGTICIADTAPRAFTARDIELLKRFSRLAMANFELRQIAARDQLTDTWSRRAFRELLDQAVSAHARNHRPLSIVTFDLDRFKSINDTYGHAAGDAVLKATARAVSDSMRRDEALGRLGGEEFAVLMHDTDAASASIGAERLRAAIEAARIADLPQLTFTASFGIATLQDGETLEAWLERADRAMYAAKTAGRNRVATA